MICHPERSEGSLTLLPLSLTFIYINYQTNQPNHDLNR